jgi:hypothetical protein
VFGEKTQNQQKKEKETTTGRSILSFAHPEKKKNFERIFMHFQ